MDFFVAYARERIVLSSRGKPKAALVSMEDYARLAAMQGKGLDAWQAQRDKLNAEILPGSNKRRRRSMRSGRQPAPIWRSAMPRRVVADASLAFRSLLPIPKPILRDLLTAGLR